MKLYRVAADGWVEALYVVAESFAKAVEYWVYWMAEHHPVVYRSSPNLEPMIIEVVAEDRNVSVGYASGLSQSLREDLDYAWAWSCNNGSRVVVSYDDPRLPYPLSWAK